ncbi:hypothetical protein HPB47_007443 [Ixodes persulcatus]|uniref:Uncharacterized protein n=1 Tax=Ixodes persulcatus TaxID=34615 RepID=A0AC60P7C2_IXOPE|nr:hypothetical protein HPB47_007443 [Ixodes persulcatus]
MARVKCGRDVELWTQLTDQTATLDDDVPMTRCGRPLLGLGEAAVAADFPPASLMNVPRSRNPPGNDSIADQKLQDVALQTGGRAYGFGDLQKNSISSMGISFILSTTSHLEDSQKPVFLVETTVDLDSIRKEARRDLVVPTQPSYTCYSSRARCFSEISHLCQQYQVAIHEGKAPLVDSRIKLIAYAGAFLLKNYADATDLAPDHVRDLAVKLVNRTTGNLIVTLSWTSTGANLDTGRADSLDLRSSLKSRDLIYKFEGATKITNDDVLEGDLTPKDPFRLHTVKVRLPQALVSASQYKPGSIFLGLRTENNRGKKSQLSTALGGMNLPGLSELELRILERSTELGVVPYEDTPRKRPERSGEASRPQLDNARLLRATSGIFLPAVPFVGSWLPRRALVADPAPPSCVARGRFSPVPYPRFSAENVASIRPYTYLPFGAGPRNCIGMRFALQAIKLCLLHSVHSVAFVRTEKTKVPLEFCKGFGILNAKDVTIGIRERLQ